MKTTVYYESWQMQCCGEPFAIGDTVKWDCLKADGSYAIKADYYYEAHNIPKRTMLYQIKGKVSKIDAVIYDYIKSETDNLVFDPVAYTLQPLENTLQPDKAEGFLVVLDDVKIK